MSGIRGAKYCVGVYEHEAKQIKAKRFRALGAKYCVGLCEHEAKQSKAKQSHVGHSDQHTAFGASMSKEQIKAKRFRAFGGKY